MTELPFKFDEIGIWSELKLEIIEQYGAACTRAFPRAANTGGGVNGDDVVGLIIAVVLLGYLLYALIAPEKL